MIAKVSSIKSLKSLNIVEFQFNSVIFKMVSLELNKDIVVGKSVELLVKPTNVIISKKFIEDISISNQISAKIVEINNGEILSNILLKIENNYLESIITTKCATKLNIKKDDIVNILIKASDLSILRVIND